MDIDERVDMRDLEWEGIFPFQQPVPVTGSLSVRAEVVTLELSCEATYEGTCDRCGAPVRQPQSFTLERMLVASLDNAASEDNEALLVVEDKQLDLDALVRSEVILHMPMKHLCKPVSYTHLHPPDCRGRPLRHCGALRRLCAAGPGRSAEHLCPCRSGHPGEADYEAAEPFGG